MTRARAVVAVAALSIVVPPNESRACSTEASFQETLSQETLCQNAARDHQLFKCGPRWLAWSDVERGVYLDGFPTVRATSFM
jgi:hypothetical protein